MARAILYFDCFSGASGDMVLGALLDAGLPIDELRRALGSLPLAGVDIDAERVSRGGVAATKFRVLDGSAHGADHDRGDRHPDHQQQHDQHHAHHTGHQPQRQLREILELVDRSALSLRAKDRAGRLFRRLAEVEAAIHQMPVEQVHLHEVGALDSIVDIVGAVHGLEWFGVDRMLASPLNVGGGTVKTAHGVLPVPAPATLRLLEGMPIYSTGVSAELVTPTGALLIGEYAQSFGPIPPMRVRAIGYGAGDRDLGDRPNLLRVLVGEETADQAVQRAVVIEFEVDDMNPQIFGPLMEQLYAAGAFEVLYAPVQMKKNRPGTLVTVVAAPSTRDALNTVIFRETTTIGVRFHEVDRECLDRVLVPVQTPLGEIRFKLARRAGVLVNAAPEFDDCARIAREAGLSLKEVQAAALKAYLDQRNDLI
ncbi:MAG: nickel pincer cofactor biosynthesis protein LarC [Acidobacteria bacterium]|nr:nickel pincer cofactor biosynthesis protein LarC [Acidobacteriota bacterium]MBI3265241.1 nickel pincer cofactor biosynthesis protein LarC [Acidobacteriota bacterium]